MEFQFSTEDATFQSDLQQFISEEYAPEWELGERGDGQENWERTLDVRRKLADRGWLTMHWPEEYGGQKASPVRTAIFNEAMTYHRAPGRDNFGVRMMGATLMIHGTDEQKAEHLPPVAKGEVQWCQGYSEPESGSDLASLSTRAIRGWRRVCDQRQQDLDLLGHRGDWIMLLTRTDTDAPKHRGISFFLVDMKTPGIEVRPIINMGNRHEFNQIIFDNVRVPARNIVGEEKRGWYVAVTLLDFERSGIDYSAAARRHLDDTRQWADGISRNGKPLSQEPWVRNVMADRYIECEVARLIAFNVAWMQGEGLVPNKEASMSKVFGSETVQRTTASCLEVMGMYGGLREDKWTPMGADMQEHWLRAFSHTIAAGTSEVQRNIIASRGLGLPRG